LRSRSDAKDAVSVKTFNDGIFMTKKQLEDLKQEVRAAAKAETLKQTNEELSIVVMEHEEAMRAQEAKFQAAQNTIANYQRREQEWTATRASLEQTLEELMTNFEATMNEYSKEKNQSLANIGLLETDVNRLRQNLTATEAEKKVVVEELDKLRILHDTLSKAEAIQAEKLKVTEGELANAKLFLEQLRQRAENKLKNAHQQYTLVQKDAAEKAIQLRALEAEVDKLRQENAQLQSSFSAAQTARLQQEERAGKLERSLMEYESRMTDLNNSHTAAQMELQTLRRQAQEYVAHNAIYKEQLSTANEELRRLKSDSEVFASMKADNDKLRKLLEVAQKENKELKSRLFDMVELEKKLKAGAARDGGGAAVAVLEHDLHDSQTKISQLTQALAAKEAENKELVSIADELLREVEALKSGRR